MRNTKIEILKINRRKASHPKWDGWIKILDNVVGVTAKESNPKWDVD